MHFQRHFYLQNVESILEDTKKGTCPSGQVPLQIMLEFQHGFPSKIKGKNAKTEIKMPCGSPHSRFQIEKHPALSQRMPFKAFLSKCQP